MKNRTIIWYRVSFVCVWIFALAAFCRLFLFTESLIASFIAIAAILVGLGIKFTMLRCANCGLSGGIPQWSTDKMVYCPRCGRPFIGE